MRENILITSVLAGNNLPMFNFDTDFRKVVTEFPSYVSWNKQDRVNLALFV